MTHASCLPRTKEDPLILHPSQFFCQSWVLEQVKREVRWMEKRTVGIVLLVIGIVILVVSLVADPLGLGGGNVVFGPRQIIGTVVGAIVAIVGVVLRLRK
jgi:hypothetical protein